VCVCVNFNSSESNDKCIIECNLKCVDIIYRLKLNKYGYQYFQAFPPRQVNHFKF